jgi:hypothetical protein
MNELGFHGERAIVGDPGSVMASANMWRGRSSMISTNISLPPRWSVVATLSGMGEVTWLALNRNISGH